MVPIGKTLVVVGIVIAVTGLLLWGSPAIPLLNRLGRLPGDVYVQRRNFTLYFPLTSGIIVSIVLSLLLAWLRR